eukprot:m.106734 g.106734  ORF g.106734 m.106734 type:complete len:228 (-) comp10599_c2_seq1:21-704(-)
MPRPPMGTKSEGSADRADKNRSATHPVADRVRGTLRHLVEAVTRVLGHWEAVSDEARDVLGRLSRTAERIALVDEANRRPGGWGALSQFDDLGPRVAVAVRRPAEAHIGKLQSLARRHVDLAVELADLCAKASRSYQRQREVIGLKEAARRGATYPSIADTLVSLDFVTAVYSEQAAQHVSVVSVVDCSDPSGVDACLAKWDHMVSAQAARLTAIVRESTITAVTPA